MLGTYSYREPTLEAMLLSACIMKSDGWSFSSNLFGLEDVDSYEVGEPLGLYCDLKFE